MHTKLASLGFNLKFYKENSPIHCRKFTALISLASVEVVISVA